MSGYVEVQIAGNTRAYLEAGSVCGVISSPGVDPGAPATPTEPMSIIMRGGDTVAGVYGVSAMRFLMRVEGVKLLMKERKSFCVIAFLDQIDQFEAELGAVLAMKDAVDG